MSINMNHPTRTFSLTVLACLFLSACTQIPVQLQGDYPTLIPKQTVEKDLQTSVRWAGIILDTRPEEDHTCFEILGRQLDNEMRPENADQSTGRFIACKSGFYDPEVFKKKREVTVTGKIVYIDVRKVGDFDYHFPIVDIEFMSLWPVRRYRPYYHYGPYAPYYWHYPHYGRYYRYGF